MPGCNLRKPVQHRATWPTMTTWRAGKTDARYIHVASLTLSFSMSNCSLFVCFVWKTNKHLISQAEQSKYYTRPLYVVSLNPAPLHVYHVIGKVCFWVFSIRPRGDWADFKLKTADYTCVARLHKAHRLSQQNERLAELMLHHAEPFRSLWIPYRWSNRWSGIWLHQQSHGNQLCGARPAQSFI